MLLLIIHSFLELLLAFEKLQQSASYHFKLYTDCLGHFEGNVKEVLVVNDETCNFYFLKNHFFVISLFIYKKFSSMSTSCQANREVLVTLKVNCVHLTVSLFQKKKTYSTQSRIFTFPAVY